MNYLVVIDTNVPISALLSKHSDAATVQVLNAVFDGTIIPVFKMRFLQNMIMYFTVQSLSSRMLTFNHS